MTHTKNVYIVWAGTNDIYVSAATAAATYTAMKNHCTAAKAAGFTVVAVNCMPRSTSSPLEAIRITFNSSLVGDFGSSPSTNIRTGAAYADYLIDIGSDANLGLPGSQNSLTYFNSDKIHLTDAGYAIVAGYAQTVLGLIGIS